MKTLALAAALGLATAAAAQTGTTTMTATGNTATSTGSYAGVGASPVPAGPPRMRPRAPDADLAARPGPLLAIDAGLPATIGRLGAAGALGEEGPLAAPPTGHRCAAHCRQPRARRHRRH